MSVLDRLQGWACQCRDQEDYVCTRCMATNEIVRLRKRIDLEVNKSERGRALCASLLPLRADIVQAGHYLQEWEGPALALIAAQTCPRCGGDHTDLDDERCCMDFHLHAHEYLTGEPR